MRPYKKYIFTVVLCCLIFIIESCTSSLLSEVWSDPSYNEPPLENILIIAVRKDPVQRRIWEDAFVDQLSKHNVKAKPSYYLFPNELPDTNQVVEIIQGKGFDGILITRLLTDETETRYVQSYITSEMRTRYNPFRKIYTTYYRDIYHPGYFESQTIGRRAIEVWVIRNQERIIWGATSNTPELNSEKAVQNDITNLVIDALAKNDIIKSKK